MAPWVALGLAVSLAVGCVVESQGASAPAEAEPLVEQARADLAQRTGLEPSAITLQSVEAVEWPDASLGCPQPDRFYAQVVTPGYRIVLEAGGERYAYHTSMVQVAHCPEDR